LVEAAKLGRGGERQEDEAEYRGSDILASFGEPFLSGTEL
jgi:hypothetical protein